MPQVRLPAGSSRLESSSQMIVEFLLFYESADPNSVAPVKYTMTSIVNLFSYPTLFERAGIPSDKLPNLQQRMQAYVNSCGAQSSNCQPPGIARCAAGE